MSDVVTRVQRLIALAASSNENEARSAAHKACALIREHKLVVTSSRPQPQLFEDPPGTRAHCCAFCGAPKPCHCVYSRVVDDAAQNVADHVRYGFADEDERRARHAREDAERAERARPGPRRATAVAPDGSRVEVEFSVDVDGVRFRAKPYQPQRPKAHAPGSWCVACSGPSCLRKGPTAVTEIDAVLRAQAEGFRWKNEVHIYCARCQAAMRATAQARGEDIEFFQKRVHGPPR